MAALELDERWCSCTHRGIQGHGGGRKGERAKHAFQGGTRALTAWLMACHGLLPVVLSDAFTLGATDVTERDYRLLVYDKTIDARGSNTCQKITAAYG